MFDILKRYDHYLAAVNVKIGLLLSFLGVVVVGISIRLSMVGPGDFKDRACAVGFDIISIATIAASLWAIHRLLRAASPDTRNSNGDGSLIFFGAVSKNNSTATEYYGKVSEISSTEFLADCATQVYNVAGVLDEKCARLKAAISIVQILVAPLLLLLLVYARATQA
jgi:hypothetical protein